MHNPSVDAAPFDVSMYARQGPDVYAETFDSWMHARPGSDMCNRSVDAATVDVWMYARPGPDCLTPMLTLKDVYFLNNMRVKPSPRSSSSGSDHQFPLVHARTQRLPQDVRT